MTPLSTIEVPIAGPGRGDCGVTMRELLRSNDPVLLSLAEPLLRQAGITSVLAIST
jgi:hypothetical protein